MNVSDGLSARRAEKAGLMPPASRLETQDPLLTALAAAGSCAYRWNIGSDELKWSPNAAILMGAPGEESIRSGRNFASLLDPGNVTSRFETVMRSASRDMGEGVAYRIEYLLRPQGRNAPESVWVEDHGRWFAGSDGKPSYALGIVRRIDERQKREQSLRYLGNFDPLTGMMNRGRFTEALGEVIAAAKSSGASAGLLLISIANIESINEAYGFATAEETIVAIARRLRHVLRQGDTIARFSGSKFAVMLANCNEQDLEPVSERFLAAARDSMIDTLRGPVWAMLAIGGLTMPLHGKNPSEAVAHAEEALNEARRTHTDRAIFFRPDPEREALRVSNSKAGADIVDTLKADRFCLAYQPIVDSLTGEPAMYEVLLRMRQQDNSIASASHLIPVAERLGIIRLIDDKVTSLALETLSSSPEAFLTFNLSGITATDPRWFSQIIDRIAAYGSMANRLVVEITESAALHDLTQISRFIERLKELGCQVAIDDFGAGYTSFRNLRDLNVDLVKLDGGFCVGLSQNRDNQFFVRTLLDLARRAGLKTVAEWVESEEDAALLREWGADYMQGFLFGRAENQLPWAPGPSRINTRAFERPTKVSDFLTVGEPPAFNRRKS
jgi:diguanylate cyclase (GGDEF)-like protein